MANLLGVVDKFKHNFSTTPSSIPIPKKQAEIVI